MRSFQWAVFSWQWAVSNLTIRSWILNMGTFRDLIVYRKAFQLAMEIFELTKKFPVEEKYSLIDQIRRSSRSVVICLAEGYRKRRYTAHFVAKATDSDMENTERRDGWILVLRVNTYQRRLIKTRLLKVKKLESY